jgi:hypothetical protein
MFTRIVFFILIISSISLCKNAEASPIQHSSDQNESLFLSFNFVDSIRNAKVGDGKFQTQLVLKLFNLILQQDTGTHATDSTRSLLSRLKWTVNKPEFLCYYARFINIDNDPDEELLLYFDRSNTLLALFSVFKKQKDGYHSEILTSASNNSSNDSILILSPPGIGCIFGYFNGYVREKQNLDVCECKLFKTDPTGIPFRVFQAAIIYSEDLLIGCDKRIGMHFDDKPSENPQFSLTCESLFYSFDDVLLDSLPYRKEDTIGRPRDIYRADSFHSRTVLFYTEPTVIYSYDSLSKTYQPVFTDKTVSKEQFVLLMNYQANETDTKKLFSLFDDDIRKQSKDDKEKAPLVNWFERYCKR